MTLFVLLALVMTAAATGVVLLGARARPGGASRAEANIAVLRQQLQELERERGALAEYEALREELRQRLLLEAQPAEATTESPRRWPLIASAALLPALAAAVYAAVGSPEAMQEAGAPLLVQLEARVAAAADDARAWMLLARMRMDADQFESAALAYSKAIEASRKVATDPQVWAEYADALGMSQGGTLAGRPREAIDRALALDPRHPKALELAGSAAYEARDFRAARAHWSALLAQLPADSPLRAPLAAAVEKAERLARFSLPAS